MNVVTLMGRLTANPELKTTNTGGRQSIYPERAGKADRFY